MIKSMTGYGRAESLTATGKIIVEIRSLNGKVLDLSLRSPSMYRSVEALIRQRAAALLGRGKVDISITFQGNEGATSSTINRDAFKGYYHQLVTTAREIGFELSDDQLLPVIMRMPEVFSSERRDVSEDESLVVLSTVERACAHLGEFREQEGSVLIRDIIGRTLRIGELLNSVEQFEAQRIETVRQRLSDNLARAAVVVDTNRFETEIIYYLEKFDVTEEKVRLAQHIAYFAQVAESDGEAGRKLGFIGQEMGREINTLGSKANHSEMQKVVVEMKDELEKIKEQLLNVL